MEKELSPYEWEYTDTFGGEANYCWVRRGVAYVPTKYNPRYSQAAQARIIKRDAGLTGVRGRSAWRGDEYEFRPYNCCTVLFARYHDCITPCHTHGCKNAEQ